MLSLSNSDMSMDFSYEFPQYHRQRLALYEGAVCHWLPFVDQCTVVAVINSGQVQAGDATDEEPASPQAAIFSPLRVGCGTTRWLSCQPSRWPSHRFHPWQGHCSSPWRSLYVNVGS